MPQDTQTLLNKALKIGDSIIAVVGRFMHSRSICDKLCNKVNGAQSFLKDLSVKYENNKEYFEQKNYNSAFNNYVTVVENCLNFLEAIEHKALFVRLINGDKYKKTFYRLFIDIDQAVSVLHIGMSVKNQLNITVNQDTVNSEILKSQDQMALIASRVGGFDDILAESDQREVIIEEIRNVQENKTSTADILASVEIPQRQVKTIPGLLPRQGRRYTVYKRLYQGKVVAEKTLKESLGDEKLLSDMRKQVAILKRLAVCPYIIQFIGVCIKGNKLGLITDYAEKGSLKDLLESTHRIDKDLKYKFTVDVVEGVAFLHEMGVLHKNLKTSSILITEDDKAKISGFEFSREIGSGTAIIFDDGSDRYRWIPPEKILDYFESTSKSDVYSLGMVMWSIWSRRYPYEIMSQQAIEDLVGRGGREDVTQVPGEIRPIINACWQQDPKERPNATDIINELDTISNQTGESEIVPENMQNLWSEENVAKAGQEFAAESGFATLTNEFESFNMADESNIQANGNVTNHNNIRNSGGSFTSPIHSRPSSLLSLDSPTPSAPAMNMVGSMGIDAPNYNINQMPMPMPYQPASREVNTSNVTSPPKSKKSDYTIGETRIFDHDQEDFDLDEDLFDEPKKPAFSETHLFIEDLDDDLDLFSAQPTITLEEALDLHNNGNRKEAFEGFLQLADFNDTKAHYYLGYYYFWGQKDVIDKDWDKALHHFEVAAKDNDSDAMDHLGMYYSSEENKDKNLVKAFEYYKKSADLGNKKGYYHLGVCYAKGRGTHVNKSEAIKCIQEAANRGHSLAVDQLSRGRRN